MDYNIYLICENACDCIPQFDASPTVPAISITCGNCQAHAHYNGCSFLREFMDASQLLTDPDVYGSFLLLETAQDRVSESNEVPLFDTGASTDTSKPLSVWRLYPLLQMEA
jgi:hypothetical protein